MRYIRLSEFCESCGIDSQTVRLLVEEGLVEVKHSLEDEELLSESEADRLRVGSLLLRDLDVNLAGVEVALHLRDELLATQAQFDQILSALVEELRRRVG